MYVIEASDQMSQDPGLFVEQAEDHTGIMKQQVSRWAKRLKDIPQYRDILFGADYKKSYDVGRQLSRRDWRG
jgi:hypothetical protein